MDSLSQRPNFALTATALLMRSSNFRLTSKNVTEFRSGRAIQIGGKSYTFALSTLHIISLAFLTIATAGFVWAILAIKLCVDRKNAKSQIAILYAALSRPTATDDQVHPVEPQLQGAFTVDLAPAHCDEPEAAETLQEEEGAQPSGQEAQQIAAAQSPPPIANAPQQQPGMPAPQSAAGSATSTIAPPSPQQLPQQSGSAVPPPPPVQPPLSPTATASGAPAASEEAADDPPAATAMDKPAQQPSTEIARPVELQGAFTVDLAPAHCDEPEAAETPQEEESAQTSGQEQQRSVTAPSPIANALQQQSGIPAPQSAAWSATSTIAPPLPQQLPQQSGSAAPPPPPVQPPLSPTATASGAPAASEEAADDPPAATAMDKPAQRPSTEIARPVELQGAFTVDLAPAHCDEPEAAETLQEEEGGRKRESAQTNDAAAAKFLEAAFDLEPGAMLYGSTCNSVAALFKCIAKLSAEGKTPEGGICLSDFVAHRGDNGASAAAAVNALLSEVRQFSRREGMWNAENATEADLAKWNSVIFLFGHRAKANNSFSQFYQEALDLIRQGELDPARTEDGARSSAAEIVRTALSIEKSARAIFDNAYASTAGIGSGDPSETKITLFDHLGEAVRQAIIARLVVSLLCKQHNSRLISPLKRIAVLLQTEAKKVASDYPEIDVRKAAIAFSGAIKAAFKEKKGEVNDLWANHFADIEVAIAKCDAAYENYALESGASKKKLSDQTAPASWRSS